MISASKLSNGCWRTRPRLVGGSVAVFGAILLCVLLLTGRRANAMQLTPSQKQEMKQHYERATRAYDVQKYTEAVDEYQKAYEIGGDPAMLYNVAQSYRLADQLPDALRFYRRYLQRSPNARNREDVERKIADLEKTVEERKRAAAAAATAAPPAEPALAVVAPAPSPEPSASSAGSGRGKRIAGIVLASVGAAGLITAAVTGKMAGDKGDELTKASMSGGTFNPDVEASGKTLNTIAQVSAIAGGVAAITGTVLIVMSGGAPAEERRAQVSPVVGAGFMGATAVLRF